MAKGWGLTLVPSDDSSVNMSMFSGSKSPSDYDQVRAPPQAVVTELDFFPDARESKPGDDGDANIRTEKEVIPCDPADLEVNVSILFSETFDLSA